MQNLQSLNNEVDNFINVSSSVQPIDPLVILDDETLRLISGGTTEYLPNPTW